MAEVTLDSILQSALACKLPSSSEACKDFNCLETLIRQSKPIEDVESWLHDAIIHLDQYQEFLKLTLEAFVKAGTLNECKDVQWILAGCKSLCLVDSRIASIKESVNLLDRSGLGSLDGTEEFFHWCSEHSHLVTQFQTFDSNITEVKFQLQELEPHKSGLTDRRAGSVRWSELSDSIKVNDNHIDRHAEMLNQIRSRCDVELSRLMDTIPVGCSSNIAGLLQSLHDTIETYSSVKSEVVHIPAVIECIATQIKQFDQQYSNLFPWAVKLLWSKWKETAKNFQSADFVLEQDHTMYLRVILISVICTGIEASLDTYDSIVEVRQLTGDLIDSNLKMDEIEIGLDILNNLINLEPQMSKHNIYQERDKLNERWMRCEYPRRIISAQSSRSCSQTDSVISNSSRATSISSCDSPASETGSLPLTRGLSIRKRQRLNNSVESSESFSEKVGKSRDTSNELEDVQSEIIGTGTFEREDEARNASKELNDVQPQSEVIDTDTFSKDTNSNPHNAPDDPPSPFVTVRKPPQLAKPNETLTLPRRRPSSRPSYVSSIPEPSTPSRIRQPSFTTPRSHSVLSNRDMTLNHPSKRLSFIPSPTKRPPSVAAKRVCSLENRPILAPMTPAHSSLNVKLEGKELSPSRIPRLAKLSPVRSKPVSQPIIPADKPLPSSSRKISSSGGQRSNLASQRPIPGYQRPLSRTNGSNTTSRPPSRQPTKSTVKQQLLTLDETF